MIRTFYILLFILYAIYSSAQTYMDSINNPTLFERIDDNYINISKNDSFSLGIKYYSEGKYGDAFPYLTFIKKHYQDNHIIDKDYLIILEAIKNCVIQLHDVNLITQSGFELIENYKKVYGAFSDEHIEVCLSVSEMFDNNQLYSNVVRIQKKLYTIYETRFGKYNDFTENAALMIAVNFANQEDYYEAISWMRKVLIIEENTLGVNCERYMQSLIILASYYNEVNKSDDLIKCITKIQNLSLQLYGGLNLQYADCLSICGKFYYHQNNISQAIECEQQAYEIRNANLESSTEEIISSLNNLSLYSRKEGNLQQAITLMNQAIERSERDNNLRLTLLNNLSTLYAKNNPDKAIKILSNLIDSVDSINTDLRWSLYVNLVEVLSLTNRYEEAIKNLLVILEEMKDEISNKSSHLSEDSKYYYWDKYWLYYCRVLPSLVSEGRNLSYAGDVYNYSALFPKLLYNRHKSNIGEIDNKTWTNIKGVLNDGEIAVEFIEFVHNNKIWYYALIVNPNDHLPTMIPIISEEELSQINYDRIYNKIWQPIITVNDNIKSIYFSPVGLFEMINNEDFVGDNIKSYRLSSTTTLLERKAINRDSKKAVLFGGLDYTPQNNRSIQANKMRAGFDYLPYSLSEISDLRTLLSESGYKVYLYSLQEGSEKVFKSLSNTDANILHISTHGIYVNNTGTFYKKIPSLWTVSESTPSPITISRLHSALVLSGGNLLPYKEEITDEDNLLTANEISNLSFCNVDLLVLSACDTGLGDFSQNYNTSIAQAFKLAGVKTILMSIAKVNDEATKLLMVEFYRNLMNGKTKHQSLKDAQKYLREYDNGKYAAPQYWASFIMLDGLN